MLLLNGESVVIDDCNTLKRTRSSFIKAIKEKVPNIKISAVEFKPVGGIDQCLYVSQWPTFKKVEKTLASVKPTESIALCKVINPYHGYNIPLI